MKSGSFAKPRTSGKTSRSKRQRQNELEFFEHRKLESDPGHVQVADRYESGKSKGHKRSVIFGTTGPQGGISSDPGVKFAWLIRKKMRPFNISPVTVTDAAGKPIANVMYDPVTGERTRRELR